MRGRFLSLIAFAALGGCVAIDTGYIDYRRAEDVDALRFSADNQPQCNYEASPQGKGNDQRDQTYRKPGDPRVCYPLLGAKLYRKNMAGNGIIKPPDIYSIRLDHGYMQFVSEYPFRPDRLFGAKNPFRAQAEIVVLARAFEFGIKPAQAKPADSGSEPAGGSSPVPAPAPAANTLGFLDLEFDSLNAARVIYYSPDVENGQSLNFSNIPILGPVQYQGQPVGIQIIVLELDRISKEMKGLLTSLASLGQTAGALPTGGAAGILTNLGKSLLESNQDDIIFEYRFVLDPATLPHSYNAAPFEAGRYVLRRLQRRDAALVWRNLLLDHNTGQLFLETDAPDKKAAEPYEEETYFTVNIIKHGPGVQETSHVLRTMAELNTAIAASATARDGVMLGQMLATVQDKKKALLGAQAMQKLASQWDEVMADANRLAFSFPPNTSPNETQCQIDQSKLAGKRVAEYEMTSGANDFVRDWSAALADPAAMTFGAAEQGRVVDMVASFFLMPSAQGESGLPGADAFLSDAAFKTFMEQSLTTALGRYVETTRPKDCAQLVAGRLATETAPVP